MSIGVASMNGYFDTHTCNIYACMHAYDDVYDTYDASDTCDEWCILMVLKIGDVGIAMYTASFRE